MSSIDDVLISIRRVIRATDLYSRFLAKTTGLTAPQLLVLLSIQNKDEATIGQLAQDVSLSQATVTTILDRLEKRELVYRERSVTDKRKVHAYLTDKALPLLKDAPAPLQDHFAKQFSDLQDWEKTMIVSSLQRIAHMMDAEHIDASPVLDIGIIDRQQPTRADSATPFNIEE